MLFVVDVDDEEVSRISRNLYKVMTNVIGSEDTVLIRRTGTNLRDDIIMMERELTDGDTIPCFSGSKAEGLRFETSDEDWMYVYRTFRVIPSDSYACLYYGNLTVSRLLIMDNEMTKPGFTLLRVMDKSKWFTNDKGQSPIVWMFNAYYIPSKEWREVHLHQGDHSHMMQLHGPCTTSVVYKKEYDWAHCLKCEIWPANARSCIHRLRQSSWFSDDIIRNIVRDGVLFVPIGAKQSFFEDTEWRMSFSLAEKKLIHSMNHTQFLCYGLLKVFLKEAIESEEQVKGLLFSYFLKTALFWEITEFPYHWNPSSLLSYFWKCLCRLIQWVSCSYCPNFFVPENNMFEGKIEGENRVNLLQHLGTLHQEGYRCLLRCPSLESHSMTDVMNRNINHAEKAVCKGCIAMDLIKEGLAVRHIFCFKLNKKIQCLLLHRLMNTTNNSLKRFMIKTCFSESLIQICRCQSSQSNLVPIRDGCNKVHYKNHKQRMNVFNQCRTDSACHYLYQAMECYSFGKYRQTIRLAQQAREVIFSQNSVITHWDINELDRKMGNEELSIQTIMEKFAIGIVRYDNNIPELFIEAFTCRENHSLPAAICALFLQYLSYNKFGLQRQRDEALLKLSRVIYHNDNDEISWQILGICQQMSGDIQTACHSYRMALHHKEILTDKAVFIRLGTLLAKYFLNQRLTEENSTQIYINKLKR